MIRKVQDGSRHANNLRKLDYGGYIVGCLDCPLMHFFIHKIFIKKILKKQALMLQCIQRKYHISILQTQVVSYNLA